jgi:hypothetical protein
VLAATSELEKRSFRGNGECSKVGWIGGKNFGAWKVCCVLADVNKAVGECVITWGTFLTLLSYESARGANIGLYNAGVSVYSLLLIHHLSHFSPSCRTY